MADDPSRASRLIGTPRKRTISAREVCHGQSRERRWSATERCGATARVWRSGARARWQDVATAQDRRGAPAVARRGPETVSRELGVTAATLTGWHDAFLAAGE